MNHYFSYALISIGPLKTRNFENFWTWKIFTIDFALNIRGPEREHPLFLSEPNESDIIIRQIRGEKLKYLNFT